MTGDATNTSQVAAGDLLDVTIASGVDEEEPKPIRVRVSNDGTALVPLIGPVAVAGLEPFQAEERIGLAAVERQVYRQPYVTLTVAERAVNRVTVLGAVAQPGVLELPRGASDLVSALGAAGGLSEEAGTEVEILHHGSTSFLADGSSPPHPPIQSQVALASYEDSSAPAADPSGLISPPRDGQQAGGPLLTPSSRTSSDPQTVRIDLAQADQAGATNCVLGDRDVVMVLPKRKQFIHVSGLVNRPDQFEVPRDQDVRVLDAIAMAGGVSSPVADKVFVIRQGEGMPEAAVIEVSLAEAKHDGNENILLTAGDLVSVETTVSTTVVDTLRDFFHVAVGLGGNLVTF